MTTIAWRLAHIMVGCFVMRLDNEEFGGPRDVFPSSSALRMQHSVLPNRLSLGIGEKWKRVAPGLAKHL